VHLDVDYAGGVEIIISTKLNLMKLKAANGSAGGVFSFRNDEQEPMLVSGFADEAVSSAKFVEKPHLEGKLKIKIDYILCM